MIVKQDSLVNVARRVITYHDDLAAALEALRVTLDALDIDEW